MVEPLLWCAPRGFEQADWCPACARGEINRRDWGMEFNVKLDTGGVLVGEKVKIDLDVELVAQVPAEATA